jgi:hypothetical protein
LNSLIERLQSLLKELDTQLEFSDYDTFDELSDEQEDGENPLTAGLEQDRAAVAEELQKLMEYANLAKSITNNAKGDNLLTALQQGFDETEAVAASARRSSSQNPGAHKNTSCACFPITAMRVRLSF